MSNQNIKLPTGLQLTPLDPDFRENPYPILDRIRSQKRVLRDDELGSFIYTHHDDVKQILRDKDMWTDPRKANPGTFNYNFLGGDSDEEPSMLMMDEPDHRRLRSLVTKPFRPAAVEKWRDRTRTVVQRVLNNIEPGEVDLIETFAGPIPTVVIAELLGIDTSHHADFKAWSDTAVTVAFNPSPSEEEKQAADIAITSLNNFFINEIAQRRNKLGDDLLSDMIRSEEAGSKLTEEEIVQQCNLLLIAGNVTTTDLIGNGIKALLDHPEQLQRLREEPELIKNAVEEMLRFDSPVTNSGRIANQDLTMGGCPIPKGESMSTSLAAANRDPDVYPEPNRFDIERIDTHHQSFGGGRHLCLGAHLARLEAQESILGLLDHFDHLTIGDKPSIHAAIPGFRGFANLWVKVS